MPNREPPTVSASPAHGGDLASASERFNIPLEDWLDLSTGINPDGYPVPAVPDKFYRRLPQKHAPELMAAARRFYACRELVVSPGSQRLIELLPTMRTDARVAIPDVGYQEHYHHWQRWGHDVSFYNGWEPDQLTENIVAAQFDCVIVINPCNPTAALVDIERLHIWQSELAKRGGWLIIDEAYIDTIPHNSFAPFSHLPGVIVLRSFGKYFGLPGLRIGFALCESSLSERIATELGPWPVGGPAQYIATCALEEFAWHTASISRITRNSIWTYEMLRSSFQQHALRIVAAPLFVSVVMTTELADRIYLALAKRGILVRKWPLPDDKNEQTILRFGLVSDQDELSRNRFRAAIAAVMPATSVI